MPFLPQVLKSCAITSFQPPMSSCLVVKFKGEVLSRRERSNQDYIKLDLKVHETGWLTSSGAEEGR